MAGNVREWVNDWYAADYYSSSPTNDPTGPTSGTLHILRGGNWADGNQMHVAGRAGGTPTAQDNFNGFRCVK
jgi:formylglycine-generating enzyme required for sulfatase activity